MNAETDIRYIKGVGETRAKLFNKLGVGTLAALLRFYPRDYEDWSTVYSVSDAPEGVECCVGGVLAFPPETKRISEGRIIVKTAFVDGSDSVNIVFFNNKYVASSLTEGEEYVFFGKLERDPYSGGLQMVSPKFARSGSADGSLRPIYHQTEKLSSNIIAKCVRNALDSVKDEPQETLPQYLIEKYKLPSLYDALEKIHFPKSTDELADARRRLVFEELLSLEIGLLCMRPNKKSGRIIEDRSDEFARILPFALTSAQQRAIADTVGDMKSGNIMRRLIQGDVGSGKTAVAASAVYSCVKSGYQAAMMAPTEVLAVQHYHTFLKFFENTGIRTAVLLGAMSKKSKNEVKRLLSEGEIDFVIGTHALIQDDVEIKNLALVITDEQHRFGVGQRSALAEKSSLAHMLVMSATPIPRTLGLIIYGDLDISVIDELPRGRIPVATYCVNSEYRPRIYRFLEKHFREGRQGYIICPLVEEGKTETEMIPARDYYEYLQNEVFPNRRLGLLHGKMKPQDKEHIMSSFEKGEIDLLVSTTVVEVGVDVPNAAVMVIENAERFGLSQLHQLRGRVGRGEHKSFCVLISDSEDSVSKERLGIICSTSDGFKIADEDLRLRGPGDFFGMRQHGLPLLKIADVSTDVKILTAARSIAERIIARDPELSAKENEPLKRAARELFGDDGIILN